MTDKTTVDYTNYPPGSFDLSDPSKLPRMLNGMTGGKLAIVANLALVFWFKDLSSAPPIAYAGMAAITLLGVLSQLKGDKKRGETSVRKAESTNELGCDRGGASAS